MTIQFDREMIELFDNPSTAKILLTSNNSGETRAEITPFLYIQENGNLIYLELLGASRDDSILIRNIGFDRSVSITLKDKNGVGYAIKASPIQAIAGGIIYSKYYEDVKKSLKDVELVAVWVMQPNEIMKEERDVIVYHDKQII